MFVIMYWVLLCIYCTLKINFTVLCCVVLCCCCVMKCMMKVRHILFFYVVISMVLLFSTGTDADEDEDYSPDDAGPLLRLDLDLEEDEDTDDEYFNVTRKEVHDLVDASLQVLAKNSTPVAAGAPIVSSIKSNSNSGSESTNETLRYLNSHNADSFSAHSNGSNNSQSTVITPGKVVNSTGISPTERFEHFEQLEQMQKRNRLISAVVSKMFAGENEDSFVVDDMPIHNIRKLVARQMSMSLQLMIQMLLLSENMSEADRQCSSHLMELSNLRSCKSELMPVFD